MSSPSESQEKESSESRLLLNNYIQLSTGKNLKKKKGTNGEELNLWKIWSRGSLDIETTAQSCEEPHDCI